MADEEESVRSSMPEDVLFQILLWLPVSSVLRFKSVSKSWLSLIQTSAFINQHLLHHHRNADANLLIFNPDQCASVLLRCFCPSFTILSRDSFQVSRKLDFPHHFDQALLCSKIIASCNGIICLKQGISVSLWNPAMKQVGILPEPNLSVNLLESNLCISFGFGHDTVTNDYKLLRIVIHLVGSSCPDIRTEIFSLITHSWTTLDAVLPVHYLVRDPKSPLPNGYYYWLGRVYHPETESYHDMILTFDFSKEVFGAMALPDVYTIDPRPGLILGVLNGNLSCIDWEHEPPENETWHCKIWMMNEYGVKESWTQLYTITLESYAFPIGFSKNGKIVWTKMDPITNEKNLCLYGPVTQYSSILPPQRSLPYNLQIVVYKESLVSIRSVNGAQ